MTIIDRINLLANKNDYYKFFTKFCKQVQNEKCFIISFI